MFDLTASSTKSLSSSPTGTPSTKPIVYHTVDLQTQRGDSWETQASAYMSEQRKIKRLDAAAVGAQTGPRIVLPRHGPIAWHGAFAQAVRRRSAGRPRGGLLPRQRGGGAAVTWLPTPGWSVELGAAIAGIARFIIPRAIPPPISRPVR